MLGNVVLLLCKCRRSLASRHEKQIDDQFMNFRLLLKLASIHFSLNLDNYFSSSGRFPMLSKRFSRYGFQKRMLSPLDLVTEIESLCDVSLSCLSLCN